IYTRAILDASAFRAFDDPNANLAYAAVSVPSLLELERQLADGNPTNPKVRDERPGSRSPQRHREGTEGAEERKERASALAVSPPCLGGEIVPSTTDLAEKLGVSHAPPPDSPREGIRFDGVTFRYPGRDADVLAGLDLTIPAGQSLAIVGTNGAGKTTLIKLLCRLYEPTAGRITVDGRSLGTLDSRGWQRRIAAIFQDFARYHLSARDNVALGAPELADDRDRLRAAAEKAGALDLIESLPAGWETILSRQYTGGVDLSGGQWQRIALARALFAVEGGARVLILDEPTASLDVRAEAALYDRFLAITEGLTTIIVSHRFSTVRRADRICVLADGVVAEQGTHDELVARGGRYATLFALQASRFAESGGDPGCDPL
ncbi:MAG: ABC transporter ATP-binding protein, partial [Chloroflexota bacterium]